tara:strand:- start:2890 stop:4164 length:1275 start_codon:yes stop_codon:yes gene_type:complete
MENKHSSTITCGFCGKEEGEEVSLVKGKEANICEDCITVVTDIFNSSDKTGEGTKKEKNSKKIITPQTILEHLDSHIIKQDQAKKTVATAIYNHYKRIHLKNDNIKKSDILISGPSGCGKTTIVSTVAKILDIPLVIVDATKLTQTGYVGADVDGILTQLYLEAEGDLEKAQNGIVFIDEMDKILQSQSGNSLDIGGSSVQRELLKVIEGGTFHVSKSLNKRSEREDDPIKFNTSNNLFICSGAFEGIYDIIKERLNIKRSIGFNTKQKDFESDDYSLISYAEDEDFIKYGFLKEIIGRIPIKTFVNKLEKDDLVTIIKTSKESPIPGYKDLLSYDNIDLEITDDAIDFIATKAFEKNTGARGIRSVFENRLLDVMFDAPMLSQQKGVSKITINNDYISGKSKKPLYSMKNKESGLKKKTEAKI